MINLTTTSDIIRLVTSAAVALDVHADFVDHTSAAYTPGRQNTTITTATTTTVLSSPAASTQRSLKHMILCARGGANTVTVEFFDGANAFRMHSFALSSGEVLEYTDTEGWRTLDSSGNIQVSDPLGPGQLLRPPQYVTASNPTFAHAPGTRFFVVEGVGGGGGGGGAAAVAGAGGNGGNSGNWGRRTFTSVNGTSAIVIGAAGTTGSGAAGGNGGNSTFTHNGTTLTLPGGIGGALLAGAATLALNAANAGNAASTNADIDIVGAQGGRAFRNAAVATAIESGSGGSNPLGTGGQPVGGVASAGQGATGFGSGGGGAAAPTAAAQTGGTPRPGVFIVWDYA